MLMQEKRGKTPRLSTLHADKAGSKNISGVTYRELCAKKKPMAWYKEAVPSAGLIHHWSDAFDEIDWQV